MSLILLCKPRKKMGSNVLCLWRWFLLVIAAYSSECFCTEKSVWELGVGLGSYSSPHYLGADQSAIYTVPLPFFIYRSDNIQADRDGIFGRLYQHDKVKFQFNVSGSLPVDSKDNQARKGMPDLDLLLEAGPTVQWSLLEREQFILRLDFPLRAAFSIGQAVNYRGWVFNPRLFYRYDLADWYITTTAGPLWASEHYQDYFYQVDHQYVTTDRAYFDAASGLMGLRFSLGVTRRIGALLAGSYLNYYDLQSAENDNSPLMKQQHYASFSFMVIWIFTQSQHNVGFYE